MQRVKAEDVVLFATGKDHKYYLRTIVPGGSLQTHLGKIAFNAVIGKKMGSKIQTHLGHNYYILTPTPDEMIRGIKRHSQIIFPKDAGYIIMKLGVRPGAQVLEAGTGSGGLCLALATYVGDTGHVYSYDKREDMQAIAYDNLKSADLLNRVTFQIRDGKQGFDEKDMDAVFLDVQKPWQLLDSAYRSLKGSGVLGAIVPTNNQLVALIKLLTRMPEFGFIEAEELILRSYKTVPARIRPNDRIVGHTGFLVFARAIIPESSYDNNLTVDTGEAE